MAKALLETVQDPENKVTTYTYDENGNVETVKDPENKTVTNEYNLISQITKTITAKRYTTEYVYDKNGNLEKQVENGIETTRITYDSDNSKTKEISPKQYDPAMDDLANHQYNGDDGNRYTYYDNGKLKTETKPNGSIYTYEYDVMNRPVKEYFQDNSAAELVLLEEYAYEILADGKTQTTKKQYLNDTEVAVTVSTYDYAGRLISQKNPDNTTTSTSYNANGTVNNTTDAKGNVTYFKYDGLNRMTEQWIPFELISGVTKYTYQKVVYDKAGNKLQDIAGKDTVALYEIATQLITKTYEYYDNGNVENITDNEGRRTEYLYDDDGNVSKETVYTE